MNFSTNVTAKKIAKDSVPVPLRGHEYIYFLLNGPDIVYVGFTTDLLSRLSAHQRDKSKVFDRFYFFIPEEDACKIEMKAIRMFQPMHNVVGKKIRRGDETTYATNGNGVVIEGEIERMLRGKLSDFYWSNKFKVPEGRIRRARAEGNVGGALEVLLRSRDSCTVAVAASDMKVTFGAVNLPSKPPQKRAFGVVQRGSRYMARPHGKDGKIIYIGTFRTIEEAWVAVCEHAKNNPTLFSELQLERVQKGVTTNGG